MKIKETKEVTETKEVVIAHKCDVCGKEHKGNYFPDDWHSFSSSHNHWGNDSVDSLEYHEVCSPKCYIKKLGECVDEFENFSDAKIDEFDIQFARKFVNYIK